MCFSKLFPSLLSPAVLCRLVKIVVSVFMYKYSNIIIVIIIMIIIIIVKPIRTSSISSVLQTVAGFT